MNLISRKRANGRAPMFNFAIFRKTFADSVWTLVFCAAGLIAFVVLFSWAMLNMGTEMLEFFSKFPFLEKIFASFGIDVSGDVSISTLFAVCFTHAVTFGLAWTAIIATATRVTAGEVERGTADLLLSLPVSRAEVYVSTSLVWMLAAALISACPLIGFAIVTHVFETGDVLLTNYNAAALNFFCLNLAVGGLASMFGCLLNRRGPAIGVVVALAFFSIILNFLEQFVEAISRIGFLSLLSYFRPVESVREGGWPVQHMLILSGLALVAWTIGLIVFSRKDIPTA